MTYPFSPGEILTAVNLNAVTVPDVATTWSSPINSGITVGNGTTVAEYTVQGVWGAAYFKLTFGSSSAITGDVVLTLPVASAIQRFSGPAFFEDASDGTARALGVITQLASNTVAVVRPVVASATYSTVATALSATIPFAWATGDIMVVGPFSYRWA